MHDQFSRCAFIMLLLLFLPFKFTAPGHAFTLASRTLGSAAGRSGKAGVSSTPATAAAGRAPGVSGGGKSAPAAGQGIGGARGRVGDERVVQTPAYRKLSTKVDPDDTDEGEDEDDQDEDAEHDEVAVHRAADVEVLSFHPRVLYSFVSLLGIG